LRIDKSKPSILVVTELFPNPRGKSFSGIFIVDQLKALKQYYNIHVIVPYLVSIKEEIKNPIQSKQLINELNVHYIKYFSLILLFLGLFRLLKHQFANQIIKNIISKKIIKESELLNTKKNFVLVHGHEVLVGDEAVNVGKKLNIPSFVTIHSLYQFHTQLFYKKTLEIIIKNLNNADQIIAVSQLVKSSYQDKINCSIKIIPNGYKKKEIKQLPNKIKEIIKNKVVFLFAGFLIPSKKTDLLVTAASKLKQLGLANFVILIIGIGPMEVQLMDKISCEGLGNEVRLLGEIDPNDIPSYFVSANVIVQPSISESFSMICLEGMAYGKPVICTTNAGISEFLNNGVEAYIISPNNVDQLVDKMKGLIKHPGLRERMGQQALKKAKEFELSLIVNKLHELYQSKI